jgi:hypothetical protein
LAREPDILAALTPVVEALEALGIDYRLGGSVASSLYGVPRSTNDVDLVADVRLEHVEPLCARLRSRYYADPELLRMAVEAGSCCNFIHLDTVYKVDVFVRKRSPYDELAFSRSTRQRLAEDSGAREFDVTTAEDIVLRKLAWYRGGGCVAQHQWRDVIGVLQVQRGRLDLDYLRRWGTELGVTDLLERALAAAGGT